VLFAVAASAGDLRGASLLENGGAEEGTLSGWYPNSTGANGRIASVTNQSQTLGTVVPGEGQRFFSFGAMGGLSPGSMASLSQTGTNGLGGAALVLRGLVQTEPYGSTWDDGEATVSWLDGSSNVLAFATSGSLTTTNTQWRPFMVRLPFVPGAVRWRVELRGTLNTGTAINVFYDAIELENIPVRLNIAAWPVVLSWTTEANVFYQVQYCSNLLSGAWWPLGAPVRGNGTANQMSDPDAPQNQARFYRVTWAQ